MKASMLRTLATLLVVFAMLASLAACGSQDLVSFKVNFIVDGEVYDTLHIDGTTIELPDNPPAKEGYRFVGWYWDEGVWEKPFNAQSLVNASLASEMNIYAKFEPIPTTPGDDTPGDDTPGDDTPGEGGEVDPPVDTPDLPADGSTLTIPAFNEIAAAQPDKGATTTQKYLVTGTILSIVSPDQYGNITIEDENGNTLYIYGTWNADGTVRYGSMETKPQIGDTITVLGVACNYNGAQMKNGWIMSYTLGEGGEVDPPVDTPELPADGSTLTIPAFNEIAAAQPDKGAATTQKYLVTGTITAIVSPEMYGNITIEDENGNTLYIYGTWNADGTVRYGSMETKPQVGDTITVLGVACNYNGAQMKNGWIVEHTPDEGGEDGGDEGGETPPPAAPEAVDLAALEENVTYRLYVNQVNLGTYLYMTDIVQSGKYIAGTADPSQSALVYVEKLEGGICLYSLNSEGVRIYLTTSVTTTADGKTSRALGFASEGGAVWYVNANNILCTSIDGVEYAMGTYGEYSTISISASSYYTADAIGVSQFPIQFTYA